MARTSSARKSKTSGGKASKSRAVKHDRCKSAYTLFTSHGPRAAVLQNCSGTKLGEASRLMSEAWHKLDVAERAPYDAGAKLDKGRRDVEKLRARAARDAPKVSATVKEATSALMGLQPPTPTWVGHLADEAIAALEALDRRMDPAVRAVVGASFGTVISTPAAAASARRALGGQQGERLWALLRRWAVARAAPAAPAGGVEAHRPARSAPKKAAATSAAGAEQLTEDVRQKVVGALMRTCAGSAGRASIGTCRGIEQELFARLGSTPKEYRLRARSLLFNLRAADGILLGKVLAGTLPPSELVGLGTEELANDALKAQRKMERERYFRSEVHLAHGLPPPRRRRSSLQLLPGDSAEQARDEPGADAAAPGEPRRLRRRRSSAEPGAGVGSAGAAGAGSGAAAEAGAEGARSPRRRRCSTEAPAGPLALLDSTDAEAGRAAGPLALLDRTDAEGGARPGADAEGGARPGGAAGRRAGAAAGPGGGSSGSDSDSGSLSDSPSGGSSGSSNSGSGVSASSGGSGESSDSDESKENQGAPEPQLPGGGGRQVVLPLAERA